MKKIQVKKIQVEKIQVKRKEEKREEKKRKEKNDVITFSTDQNRFAKTFLPDQSWNENLLKNIWTSKTIFEVREENLRLPFLLLKYS